tara:strand:- start:734 stop:952 length:219 start_codon:yes stop_codon:yes gene_type:complete
MKLVINKDLPMFTSEEQVTDILKTVREIIESDNPECELAITMNNMYYKIVDSDMEVVPTLETFIESIQTQLN